MKSTGIVRKIDDLGRMVIPIGSGTIQELYVFEKDQSGDVTKDFIEYVQFVPLISKDD